MKQFLIRIPKKNAFDFSLFMAQNNIRTLMSWSEDNDLFGLDKQIVCICVADESSEGFEKFKASEYFKLVKPQ